MRTLILGLGNPILSDDSVGLRVARILEDTLSDESTTVMETSMGGLNLLDLLTGYDRAIIIDAIQTRNGKPGQIYQLDSEAFNITRHASSPHDVNFTTSLEFGKRLGLALPQQITIFAIEVENVGSFGETCTPAVEHAIPLCVKTVREVIENEESSNYPAAANRGGR